MLAFYSTLPSVTEHKTPAVHSQRKDIQQIHVIYYIFIGMTIIILEIKAKQVKLSQSCAKKIKIQIKGT